MELKRQSGILAHPTSFPSPYGIGDLGSGAYSFIDFIYKGKQNIWQILPLNPTGFGDSPYQSFSTFACNSLLISPEGLIADGLLAEDDALPEFKTSHEIDYGAVIAFKEKLYRNAFRNFRNSGGIALRAEFSEFCSGHKQWLDDYSLFAAIKNSLIAQRMNEADFTDYETYKKKNGVLLGKETVIMDYYYGAVWNSWPESLAGRVVAALEAQRNKLEDEIEYVKFLQFIFRRQWKVLKDYANGRGISIVGDLPIFVAYDSADVWTNRELFRLTGFNPSAVAGVPPDYFSKTGQLWGNPLYNWKKHTESGFDWWIKRLSHTLELVDIVRIDHFRGFEAYWSIPYGSENAVKGEWIKAPGDALFEAVREKLGDAPIIAEDLGIITEEVTALRKKFSYPGMKILQFGIEGMKESDYLPHNFDDSSTVVYTGTHDNDTTAGWYETLNENQRDYFRRYMNVSGSDPSWDLIRLAISSNAKLAVFPIQDVLGEGSESRMNTPGTSSGNWTYRFSEEDLEDSRAEGLKYLCELFNRNEGDAEEEEMCEDQCEDHDPGVTASQDLNPRS